MKLIDNVNQLPGLFTKPLARGRIELDIIDYFNIV